MSMSTVRNRIGAVLGAVLLCSFLAAGMAVAAPDEETAKATEKTEAVTATTDAEGNVQRVEVDVALKNGSGAALLTDYSQLEGIEGDDDASFEARGAELVWKTGGGDVAYSGSTDKELPIQLQVTYELNGKRVSASELAGKSGTVVIRYDYRNTSIESALVGGTPQQITTPFTCITALLLDGRSFKNIEVENGKVIQDGDDVIVAGYAMPGLKESLGSMAEDYDIPEYFELRADVQDFELDQGMTIVTAGLLSDLDTKRMGFGDMDDASHELSDAMSQLVDGAGELSEGMGALSDGTRKVDEGTASLATGAGSVASALYAFAYGTDDNPGLPGAYQGAADLSGALESLGDALDQLADANAGLPAAAKGLEAASAYLPDAEKARALQAAVSTSNDLSDEDKQALVALLESSSQIAQVTPAISQSSQALVSIDASFAQIATGSGSLVQGLGQAVEAAKQIYGGAKGVSEGAGQLSQATSQLSDGAKAAAEGTAALEGGMDAFKSQGIDKLVELVDVDLGGLKDRLGALSDSSESYDTFTGKEEGVQSSVRFVYETAAIGADAE